MRTVILILMLILVRPIASGQANPGAFWQEISFDDAIKRSEETNKPVLLYFSSPVCLACYRMDNTTLQNETLIDRITKDTIPVRPTGSGLKALQERFGVVGYPTLMLYRDGEEPLKLMGYWEPAQIAAWLDEPGSQIQQHNLYKAPVGDIHDLAVDRLLSGDLPGSAKAMAAFWTRSASEPDITPTLRWLRRDRYPSMLKHVCDDAEARESIRLLIGGFDTHEPDTTTHPALVRDWVVLLEVLSETERLDDWIHRTLAESPQTLSGIEPVFDRLIELNRPEDAGVVATEAMWKRWIARLQGRATGNPVSDAMPANIVQRERESAREKLGQFIQALRAANRQAEAETIESILP